jgi:hypothetical protein
MLRKCRPEAQVAFGVHTVAVSLTIYAGALLTLLVAFDMVHLRRPRRGAKLTWRRELSAEEQEREAKFAVMMAEAEADGGRCFCTFNG